MLETYQSINQSSLFKGYNQWILGNPWLVISVIAVLAVFFSYQAQNYQVDASADSLVLEGDEDLEFYREILKRYGTQESLVVAYQPKTALLSDEALGALEALVADLENIQGVDSITSLLNVPLLYSPKVAVSNLSKGISTVRDASVDRDLVAAELRESPIYKELLSSLEGDTAALQINIKSDERYTLLLAERERLRELKATTDISKKQEVALIDAEKAFKSYSLITAERQRVLVATVRETIAKHQLNAKKMYLGGVPMIANDMVSFVKSDLQTFGLGILIFIVVLLAIIFRSVRWVLLPLAACVLTNIFMLGLLGWLDWRMTVISSNFVALLLIITLAISVHLVVRFRELQVLYPTLSQRELAGMTVAFMLRPCVYTALTTIIAFISLVISGIRPIIDFGWMMTAGVMIALSLTFIVVPVGMLLGNVSKPKSSREHNESVSDEIVFTRYFALITEKFGGLVLLVAILLFAFAISGLTRLKVENRFIDYFDEKTEIYQGMELIDSKLGGTIPLDIILFSNVLEDEPEKLSSEYAVDDDFADDEFSEDSFDDEFFDEEGDDFSGEEADSNNQSLWFTRAGLDRVKKIHDHLESLPETGKVVSLATIYQVAKDLLGGNIDDIQLSFALNGLPEDIKATLIYPYLYVDEDEVRINVRVKETSRTLNRAQLLENLHNYMQEDLGYSPDQYRFTGMLVLYNNMLQSLFKSQILTLGAVFVAITLMLIVLFKSIWLALIGIVPNMLAALIVLGGMGWVGLPLDMMTITIAAISIGIGVDNTIHYVHRYKNEFLVDKNYINTMYRCHGSIGRAMYYTSITIIFGFSILALSNFKPSIYFGLLTGLAMFSALLGSLMLLPRLLILFKPLGKESV